MHAFEDPSDAEAHDRRVPSLTTPIALLKHCARSPNGSGTSAPWAVMSLGDCDGPAEGGDPSFRVAYGGSLAAAIAEHRAVACRRSQEPAAGHQLDDTVERHIVGAVSLRFIYLGMIAEIARGAGYAGILAEQIWAGGAESRTESCGLASVSTVQHSVRIASAALRFAMSSNGAGHRSFGDPGDGHLPQRLIQRAHYDDVNRRIHARPSGNRSD
ncbi:mycothiol transferase [Mycolicibacterium sp. 120320]|uniref:mycothiol transferase n=1 Tax=Mycolicibacterium sp. 120320 TaxID=3096110 RepID=UPI002EDBA7A2